MELTAQYSYLFVQECVTNFPCLSSDSHAHLMLPTHPQLGHRSCLPPAVIFELMEDIEHVPYSSLNPNT